MENEWWRQWEKKRKTADEISREDAHRQRKWEWEERTKEDEMAKNKLEEEKKKYESRINDELNNIRN